MRSADPKAEGRLAPRQRRLRKGYGRFLLLPDTPSNFPMSWRMGPSDARLTTPQRRRGWRSSPPQPGPKCKLGLECLALPLRATFPGDPAPQESHPDVCLVGCGKPAPTVLPRSGIPHSGLAPPGQNVGQSVPGRSDTRPFSLPGGGSALRRWPGRCGRCRWLRRSAAQSLGERGNSL